MEAGAGGKPEPHADSVAGADSVPIEEAKAGRGGLSSRPGALQLHFLIESLQQKKAQQSQG